MSELKAIDMIVNDDYKTKVYLKSEADKAIAEQKDKLQNVSSLLKETREWLVESQKLHKRCADNAVKVIRHNKYKRCLKNREICVMRFDIELARQYPTRAAFWAKWERKWLELAEKFKPNSTAQHGKG